MSQLKYFAFATLALLTSIGCGASDDPPGSEVPNAGAGAAGSAGASAGAAGSLAGVGGASAGAAGASTSGAGGASTGGASTGGASTGGSAGSAGSATAGAAPIDHDAPGVIVVLGSSTAAGTGPSKPEFAWVERYRAYLKQEFPKFVLINLAVGGYTTYQMQPSDYKPPANRPGPDGNHNITKALTSKPNAIIINMPSNDQVNKYPLSEQMTNYDRVTALAAKNGAQFWVATSQPRNFADAAQRNELVLTRDAIKQEYMSHALDFWTQFAQADSKIEPEYDSGDGIHMNDAAHALLVKVVIAAKIPEAVIAKQGQ